MVIEEADEKHWAGGRGQGNGIHVANSRLMQSGVFNKTARATEAPFPLFQRFMAHPMMRGKSAFSGAMHLALGALMPLGGRGQGNIDMREACQ
ncbi:MAG: hypothetical protein L6R48_01410 [Planctomycetes bacterium]|nr:hypothetical protein [Planctomycetota bacterium]